MNKARTILLTGLFCLSACFRIDAMVNNVSTHYHVSILRDGEWEETPTSDALCSNAAFHEKIWNDWDNSKKLRDTCSFSLFEDEFSDSVKIRVTNFRDFENVEVRPSVYGIKPVRTGRHSIELTIPDYACRKLSVEFDGNRYDNLILIGMRPDPQKPDPDDPNVIYFGPGEHFPGPEIKLKSGQTLYVDYGAIVYSSVRIQGSNCTLAGHGIISGEHFKHKGNIYSTGRQLVVVNEKRARGIRNITIKDVTLVDSPSWTMTTYNTDDVDIDGINIFSWILNGDGVDLVCGKNLKVHNCFIRTYDDCVTLKVRHNAYPMTDLCNVEVSDCIIWNDFARGIVVGIENGSTAMPWKGHIHDILVHDCIILENSGSEDMSDLRAGFAIGQYTSPEDQYYKGSPRDMENIVARDILFDHLNPTGRCVYILQYPEAQRPCTLENVLLERFTILGGESMRTPAAMILTNQHFIKGLVVKDFVLDGKKVRHFGPDFIVLGNAEVSFE